MEIVVNNKRDDDDNDTAEAIVSTGILTHKDASIRQVISDIEIISR